MKNTDHDEELADFIEEEEPATTDAPAADANEGGDVKKGSYTAASTQAFEDFPLNSNLLDAISHCGFEHPSQVQAACLPKALNGVDVICQAKSGMGKTAVFCFALLQQIDGSGDDVTGIVLCHTRELAFQITKEFERFGQFCSAKVAVVFGGVPIRDHESMLKEEKPHIIVGTPGRMKVLVEKKLLDVSKVKHFVLDECDSLLQEVGMRKDVQSIFQKTPFEKQVMLFSATIATEIRAVCEKFAPDATKVFVDDESTLTLHGLLQHVVRLPSEEKNKKLISVLDTFDFNQIVIFTGSVSRCIELNKLLIECGFPSMTIHSRVNQKERIERYELFKSFRNRILVVTDVFGRGTDCEKVNIVLNFDMAPSSDQYLHRVGRAGRFGTKGLAISFVTTEEDAETLKSVEDRFGVKLTDLPDKIDKTLYFEKPNETADA